MTDIFCGPYEITKKNVKKSYVVLSDNTISVKTYKDNKEVKSKTFPQTDLQAAIDEVDNLHYNKVAKKGYKTDGDLNKVLGKR